MWTVVYHKGLNVRPEQSLGAKGQYMLMSSEQIGFKARFEWRKFGELIDKGGGECIVLVMC